MTEHRAAALLPTGLADLMHPEAQQEATLIEAIINDFALFGYERVKPPIVEYEASLLAGMGAAVESQTFRLMDPVSQHMLGVRADMTLQVARIAATRLADRGRPLRLSYSGEALRVRGSQRRPSRQLTQVGAELIGSTAPGADAEVMSMAVSTLVASGLEELSVDVNVPTLVPALLSAHGADGETAAALRAALDRKDAAAVRAIGGELGSTAEALLRATGPMAEALPRLNAITLPEPAAAERQRLNDIVAILGRDHDGLPLTLDPVEYRGFEYQKGVSFSIFAPNVRGVLGRGGRYRAHGEAAYAEDATGVTLYMDTVLSALGPVTPQKRIYAPADVPARFVDQLRYDGAVVVAGLEPEPDVRAAARAQNCPLIVREGWVEAVDPQASGEPASPADEETGE